MNKVFAIAGAIALSIIPTPTFSRDTSSEKLRESIDEIDEKMEKLDTFMDKLENKMEVELLPQRGERRQMMEENIDETDEYENWMEMEMEERRQRERDSGTRPSGRPNGGFKPSWY